MHTSQFSREGRQGGHLIFEVLAKVRRNLFPNTHLKTIVHGLNYVFPKGREGPVFRDGQFGYDRIQCLGVFMWRFPNRS